MKKSDISARRARQLAQRLISRAMDQYGTPSLDLATFTVLYPVRARIYRNLMTYAALQAQEESNEARHRASYYLYDAVRYGILPRQAWTDYRESSRDRLAMPKESAR